MWRYFTSFACGIAIGIVVDKIVQYFKINKKARYSSVLEDCFGEPMFSNTFTVADVRDWSRAREEQLRNGNKIVVMKAIPKRIEELGKKLDIGNGVENYLIMAVVNESNKEIVESLLIKYENLEEKLENRLKDGDGAMIIEG